MTSIINITFVTKSSGFFEFCLTKIQLFKYELQLKSYFAQLMFDISHLLILIMNIFFNSIKTVFPGLKNRKISAANINFDIINEIH